MIEFLETLFPSAGDVLAALVLLTLFAVGLHEARRVERDRLERRRQYLARRDHDPRPVHFRIR